ncbi:MAG: inositol monophosphatase [Patescibacteria group bacterium]|jgi:myo-inositol-1(or 4)-monophosphatase
MESIASRIEHSWQVAIGAAKAAGEYIAQHPLEGGGVRFKDEAGLNAVTEIDEAAERIILDTVQKTFPEDSIFSEESGDVATGSLWKWVIDPLDGTTNFTHNLAHSNVSIALLYDGKPVVGVVFNPFTNELFSAYGTTQSTVNGVQLQPSICAVASKAIITLGRSSEGKAKIRHAALYGYLHPLVRTTRVLGASAIDLCMVAAGRIDGAVWNDMRHYDVAAAAFIAQNAGLIVTDFSGSPFNWAVPLSDLLIAPVQLHANLVNLLKNS